MIRIGASGNQTSTYIAGISGATSSSGVEVFINSSGQLGTVTSSRRFKYDIKSLCSQSDKLMALRPVAFRYKAPTDTGGHPIQYGLIAEEVAKEYPELVQYDKSGKPYTVRYNLLVPLMLNELQKFDRGISARGVLLAKQATRIADVSRRSQLRSGEFDKLYSQLRAQDGQVESIKTAQQRRLRDITKLADLLQADQIAAVPHTASLVRP